MPDPRPMLLTDSSASSDPTKKISPSTELKHPDQKTERFVPNHRFRWGKLTHKGQKCVLDQKNSPGKGRENSVIPVKICLLNARSMHVNTRYTKINPTD